ncbi:MAG: SCP2 sterol-binding domain-containing protein [Candidatus Thermoplasmatota archaeon]
MSVDEEKEVLEKLIQKFRKKIDEDESVEEKMKDFERDIQVDFESGNHYNLSLEESEVSDIDEGPLEDSDITIATDVETLDDLLEEEIGAMQAYASNKIKVDASLSDMLKFKKLL